MCLKTSLNCCNQLAVCLRKAIKRFVLVSISIALVAFVPSTGYSQQIDSSRGVDPDVDYEAMVKLGPWDDRNYQLTRKDLEVLSKNEGDLKIPIPVFYRVLLRKANPLMQNHGPAQYPRSALPSFLQICGGYLINNKYYRNATMKNGRYIVLTDSYSDKRNSASPRPECQIRDHSDNKLNADN